MNTFDPETHPHRRLNLLTGKWVLVSPHRAQRPWQGAAGEASPQESASYETTCYLCPGNGRANGATNPHYTGVLAFDNDFPALMANSPVPDGDDPIFRTSEARGAARVICYSPDHSATMATLDRAAVREIVDCWAEESAHLGRHFANVQVFENKGAMMGCSSPHPHGQIWASSYVPTEVACEDRAQAAWRRDHGGVLLDEVARRELDAGDRIVAQNPHWLAVVPWWAAWPFEILLVALDEVGRFDQLAEPARDALAAILMTVTRLYDALFETSFPYSMGWHQCPTGSADPAAWRLHAHFNPPLLRSATVQKFMVGFEMFAESQRDLTPEAAAARLRAAGSTL